MAGARSMRIGNWVVVLLFGCGGSASPGVTAGNGPPQLPYGGGVPVSAGSGVASPAPNGGGQAVIGAGAAAAPPSGIAGMAPVGGLAGGGGSGGAATPTAPPALGPNSWMSFGGDLSHSRATAETFITTANAPMLGVAFDIKAPGVTSTPAVYDGVVYWGDWGGIFHATKIPGPGESGAPKELWKLDRSANKGGYSGSPALTSRMVVMANRNGLLTAVDRDTGAQIWEVKLDAGPHTYIWGSPTIVEVDDMIVIGIAGAGTRDNGIAIPQSQLDNFRGSVQGVELSTGKLVWNYPISPAPGGSGCSVWSSAAVDTTLKLAFIGTGNNYSRPTSDHEDSLIALNYVTGEYVWHAQFTANDAFTTGNLLGGVDGDVGATPNLFKIGEQEVVGVGDKPAGYHVFERATGKLVWEKKSLTSSSGFQGGILQPATVADGVVYVVSNNSTISSTLFAMTVDGKSLWNVPFSDPTFGGSAYGNGVLYTVDSGGSFRAVNAKTGDVLWTTRLPSGSGGGISLVNGTLFVGYGYHFSQSADEPLKGGLMALAPGGKAPPAPTTPTSDCIPNTAVSAAPTFTNVYQGVLCANGCDKVCHTSNTGAAQLGLAGKLEAYTNLVGVPAKDLAACGGMGSRVKAGDATTSVLFQKLANTQTCGTRMPPGGPTGGNFTPAVLDAVKAWINAGAPNN